MKSALMTSLATRAMFSLLNRRMLFPPFFSLFAFMDCTSEYFFNQAGEIISCETRNFRQQACFSHAGNCIDLKHIGIALPVNPQINPCSAFTSKGLMSLEGCRAGTFINGIVNLRRKDIFG